MKISIRPCPVLLVATAALVAAVPAAAVQRRAFATSVTGTGNLSTWVGAGGLTGVAAGDNICRIRALAAGLPNADTYRAWLSSSTTDAFCHVQGLTGKKFNSCNGAPLPGAGPWYLANGLTFFTGSLDELVGTEGTIFRPVLTDEFFDFVDPGLYWTGTGSDGVGIDPMECADWTSAGAGGIGGAGTAWGSAIAWSFWAQQACSSQNRLLCLEPGASQEPGPLAWHPSALVFVTSVHGKGDLSSWPQAGGSSGLEAGDAICRNLAAAAHLPAPDSFVAWLSDTTTDARDRITTNGPFRRLDSFIVADTRADLLDGTTDNSLHQDENGHYVTNTSDVYTGTDAEGVLKTPNCLDWTASTNADLGAKGVSGMTRSVAWTENAYVGCGSPQARLYCFSNVITIFWDGFEKGDTGRWSSAVP